jgi:hypothetical protein
MLHDAELAESAIRHRLTEPTGTVRCTAAMATMQFAMTGRLAHVLAEGELRSVPRRRYNPLERLVAESCAATARTQRCVRVHVEFPQRTSNVPLERQASVSIQLASEWRTRGRRDQVYWAASLKVACNGQGHAAGDRPGIIRAVFSTRTGLPGRDPAQRGRRSRQH